MFLIRPVNACTLHNKIPAKQRNAALVRIKTVSGGGVSDLFTRFLTLKTLFSG